MIQMILKYFKRILNVGQIEKANVSLRNTNQSLAKRILELETSLAVSNGLRIRYEKMIRNLNTELNNTISPRTDRVTTLRDVREIDEILKGKK